MGRRSDNNEFEKLTSDLFKIKEKLVWLEVEKYKYEKSGQDSIGLQLEIDYNQKEKGNIDIEIEKHRKNIRDQMDKEYTNKTLNDVITDIAVDLHYKKNNIRENKYSRLVPLGKYYDEQFVKLLEAMFVGLKSI